MSLTRTEAAQALGMKTREIVAVDRVDGGYVVTTHDGQPTLVDGDGRVLARGDVLGAGGQLATGSETAEPVADTPPPGLAEVPNGTIADVLAWVDGDPERAQLAQAAEAGRAQPRTSLAEALDKIRVDALAAPNA